MATILLIMAFILAFASGVYFFAIENEKNALIEEKISNSDVVKIAQENSGWITPQLLSNRTSVNQSEASRKLYIMLSEGVFRYEYDSNYRPIFTLSNIVRKALKAHEKLSITYMSSRLTDSDVITIAVKAKGKISPTSLCVKANISVDEAKEVLENLQMKGVFDVDVSQQGSIIYTLNDFDLLAEEEEF